MNTKNQQPVENLKEAYEAPTCEIIEMQQEGVLCQSSSYGGSHGGFDEDDWSDLFK